MRNVLGNAGEANTIRIGKSGNPEEDIHCRVSPVRPWRVGYGVIVGSTGQLGTVAFLGPVQGSASSRWTKRAKHLLTLKPVTFRYKEELDPDKIPQFGVSG